MSPFFYSKIIVKEVSKLNFSPYKEKMYYSLRPNWNPLYPLVQKIKVSILLGLLIIGCTSSVVYPEDLECIAILPFSGHGISESNLSAIETVLRTEINKSNIYTTFETGSMMRILQDNGMADSRSCNGLDCAIAMGNILSIDFLTQCRIGKIEQTYTINLRILDVRNKKLIKDITEYFSGTFSHLLKNLIPKIAQDIVATKLKDRNFYITGTEERVAKNMDKPDTIIATTHSNNQKKFIEADSLKKDVSEEKHQEDYVSIGWEYDIQEEATSSISFFTPKSETTNTIENESNTEPLQKNPNFIIVDNGTDMVKKVGLSKIPLRFLPKTNLTYKEVKKMILKFDFFCSYSNYSSQWAHEKSTYKTDSFFSLYTDSMLIDYGTQLLWQREGSQEKLYHNQINAYINRINHLAYGGYSDWRLPTLEEAMSTLQTNRIRGLYVPKDFGNEQNVIWTADKANATTFWVIRFDKGRCNYGSNTYSRYVRLVRSFETP